MRRTTWESQKGSSKSLVLKSFSGERTLWDSSLLVTLTLWDTPVLFYAPLPLSQKWHCTTPFGFINRILGEFLCEKFNFPVTPLFTDQVFGNELCNPNGLHGTLFPYLHGQNRQSPIASVQRMAIRSSTWNEYYSNERQLRDSNRSATNAGPMKTKSCVVGGNMSSNER